MVCGVKTSKMSRVTAGVARMREPESICSYVLYAVSRLTKSRASTSPDIAGEIPGDCEMASGLLPEEVPQDPAVSS